MTRTAHAKMDIVERLRNRNVPYGWPELADKAASEIRRLHRRIRDDAEKVLAALNEIDRLREENAELKAALSSQ